MACHITIPTERHLFKQNRFCYPRQKNNRGIINGAFTIKVDLHIFQLLDCFCSTEPRANMTKIFATQLKNKINATNLTIAQTLLNQKKGLTDAQKFDVLKSAGSPKFAGAISANQRHIPVGFFAVGPPSPPLAAPGFSNFRLPFGLTSAPGSALQDGSPRLCPF